MCGIAGAFHFDGTGVEPALIKRMTDVIAHRGPDGEGFYIDGPIGLGHRRLAILDLSPAGKQPLCNEDGTVWVTFNGEIYNFREIRAELVQSGHVFRSQSDTEVIVHAYEEWGTDCLKRFNGMFAFGLWDASKQRLWLVRDRLGVKPLFYCQLPSRLLFGSEIKAILCDSLVPRQLDYEALAYYLALNYTPAPHTLFAGIRQLLPGHYLLIEANGQTTDVEYWDVVYHEESYQSDAYYQEEFSALLQDCVKMRLVSDVPLGAFLSGGVDSSSIAYWMAQQSGEPVKTFSIGFGEASFDELNYARIVAKSIAAEHFEHTVTSDAASLLPDLVWHAEEPTADSSMVAFYHLAKLARAHVKVALSGDGADEILAGYETYQAHYLHGAYRRLPSWLHQNLLSPLIKALPVSDTKVNTAFKLKRFVAGAALEPEEAHASWRLIFDATQRARLLSPLHTCPGASANVFDLYRAVFAQTNARHPLNRMLYVDTRFYLPNDMLVKVDRMTMAHGLEARGPFLDYRLVEFAARVPPHLKLKNGRHKKYLLKKSMQGKLPAPILGRKKQGFNVPNARWIKAGLKPFVTDVLSPAQIGKMGILNPQVVEDLLHAHFRGEADNSHQIWCLLTLSLWWEHFMEA